MCIWQYCSACNFYHLLNQMNSVNSTAFLCLDLGGLGGGGGGAFFFGNTCCLEFEAMKVYRWCHITDHW
jgi:hypothetical protein